MTCTVVHILSVHTFMTLAVIVLLFQLGTGDQSISKILWCRYKRREYVAIT